MKTKFILTLIILVLTSAGFLSGQPLKNSFYRSTDFQTGIGMQTWSTQDDRITEISIPVTFIIPVSKSLTLSAATNSAMANLTSADNSLN